MRLRRYFQLPDGVALDSKPSPLLQQIPAGKESFGIFFILDERRTLKDIRMERWLTGP